MLVFVLYAVCSCIRLFCVEVRAMAAKVWAGVGVSFYSDCREVHAKLGLTCPRRCKFVLLPGSELD